AMILVFIGTIAATVYLYGRVPRGFIPNQDTGQLQGSTEFAQDASFDSMVTLQQKVANVLADDPNVDGFMSRTAAGGGGGGGQTGNSGMLMLRLKPRSERQLTPEQVIEELRPKLNAIAGVRTYLQNPQLVRIGGFQSRSAYQYTLQAQDLNELYRSAADFEKTLKEMPELTDVSSDLLIASPEVLLDIDRNRASSL